MNKFLSGLLCPFVFKDEENGLTLQGLPQSTERADKASATQIAHSIWAAAWDQGVRWESKDKADGSQANTSSWVRCQGWIMSVLLCLAPVEWELVLALVLTVALHMVFPDQSLGWQSSARRRTPLIWLCYNVTQGESMWKVWCGGWLGCNVGDVLGVWCSWKQWPRSSRAPEAVHKGYPKDPLFSLSFTAQMLY